MHQIRYRRGDIVRLSKAIKKFNRIAESQGISQRYDYKQLKSEIFTRKEFNRQLAKLKRLTPETASTWVQDEQKREIRLAKSRLKRKLKTTPKGNYMINDEYAAIEGEIKNIENLDKLTPKVREKKIVRIANLAAADFEMKQANIYRNNYIQSLQEFYSGFEGYEKLMKKLEKITNPIDFYEQVKPYAHASDIYEMRYSVQSQGYFNEILEAWGLGNYGEDAEEEVYG